MTHSSETTSQCASCHVTEVGAGGGARKVWRNQRNVVKEENIYPPTPTIREPVKPLNVSQGWLVDLIAERFLKTEGCWVWNGWNPEYVIRNQGPTGHQLLMGCLCGRAQGGGCSQKTQQAPTRVCSRWRLGHHPPPHPRPVSGEPPLPPCGTDVKVKSLMLKRRGRRGQGRCRAGGVTSREIAASRLSWEQGGACCHLTWTKAPMEMKDAAG